MRYLLLTFYTQANGKIDEAMTVTKNLKPRDWQTCNIIMDFKEQKIIKCLVAGEVQDKDWDKIVSYYYPFYTQIIERLFEENGHPISVTADPTPKASETA
jgi:hypothetical protein